MERDREEPRLGELEDTASTTSQRLQAQDSQRPRSVIPWAVALLIILAAAWFFFPESEVEPEPGFEPEPAPVHPEVAALPPAPDIPLQPAEPEPVRDTEVEMPPEASPPPALKLENSDDVVREALAEVGSPELLSEPLQQEALLQRGAAVVDGLSRGMVLHKTLSLPRPAGKFTTRETQGGEVVDPAAFQRYDIYARAIAGLDTAVLASAFHGFRPLLEEAYSQLGYEAEDFDNALIRSLDLIIATPEPGEEIAVKPKGGVYIFADPALESLPPVQKQLLRMGPDNLILVKKQARLLRAALLGSGED
jgi:hypothetical protein